MPEKKYEIHWVIANRQTLESEAHEMSFSNEDMFWEQIKYLTIINSKNGNTVNINFKERHECTLTVWA